MSSLRLINETKAVDGVYSFEVNDVFSADFDIYCLTLESNGNVAGAFDVATRFINESGSVLTDTSYDRAQQIMWNNRAFTQSKAVNQSTMNSLMGTTDDLADTSNGIAWVFNPFSTDNYTMVLGHQMGNWINAGNQEVGNRKGIFVYKQTTQITGYQHYGGYFDETTVARTYGLRVS